MSMGPLPGIVGSAAGAPLAQTKGSEAERTQRDQAAQSRAADTGQQAEQAAGIGQTEQDEQSSDRDADGRRLWEPAEPQQPTGDGDVTATAPDTRQSKDATGAAGTNLDLTG